MSRPSNLTGPTSGASAPLSSRLWDLDWSAELPWTLDGVVVEAGSLDDWTSFLSSRFGDLYAGQDHLDRFLPQTMTEAKRRWASEMDFFVLRESGEVLGVLIAQPSDWSTYYLRNTAILPKARGRRLIPTLIGRIGETLRARGVERIQGDVSPTNIPSMRMLLSQGFVVSSFSNSERWGTCVQLTRFLRAEAAAVFARQFCALQLGGSQPNHNPPHLREGSTS